MRSCYFRFSILFLGFLVGLLSVFLFTSQKLSLEQPQTEIIADVPIEDSHARNELDHEGIHEQTGIESLISEKEKALLLFEPTLQKWLNGERIDKVIEHSPLLIERISNTKLHRYEAPYLEDRAKRSYEPSLVHLNRDSTAELAIRIRFEKSNEGDLWLFRKVSTDFEVILHSREQLNRFDLKKTRSNGLLDLQTTYFPNDPDSETLKSISDYKFDGKEYTLRGCSAIVDRYRDKNGVDLHYLKKPIFERYDDCC
jgi:hypothetical protein